MNPDRKWFVKFKIMKRHWLIGVFWKTLVSMGYEIDRRYPVHEDEHGRYQITHFDLFIQPLPAICIHLGWRRP